MSDSGKDDPSQSSISSQLSSSSDSSEDSDISSENDDNSSENGDNSSEHNDISSEDNDNSSEENNSSSNDDDHENTWDWNYDSPNRKLKSFNEKSDVLPQDKFQFRPIDAFLLLFTEELFE
jgi:hypothetical protein